MPGGSGVLVSPCHTREARVDVALKFIGQDSPDALSQVACRAISRSEVVFDTNILISALVFPGGRGEAALRRIIEEQDELVLSKPILDELRGTLARKFPRDAEV